MSHTDDMSVDKFAAAMKAKLAKKRAEGCGGWDNSAECHIKRLHGLLDYEVKRDDCDRDPVDIGNYAMMLWHRMAAEAKGE